MDSSHRQDDEALERWNARGRLTTDRTRSTIVGRDEEARQVRVAECPSRSTRLNATKYGRAYTRAVFDQLAVRRSDRGSAIRFSAAERSWSCLGESRSVADVYLQRARIHERRGQREAAATNLESYLKAVPEAMNGATIRAAIAKLRGENK